MGTKYSGLEKFYDQVRRKQELTLTATLEELIPLAEEKWRELVEFNYYQRVPVSQYYERTHQLYDCVSFEVTQGGGFFKFNVYIDVDSLSTRPPEHRKVNGKKMMWSYGYSYGQNLGEPIDDELKEELVTDIAENFGIIDDLQRWLEDTIPETFENNLEVRLKNMDYFE